MSKSETWTDALAPAVASLAVVGGFLLYWVLPEALQQWRSTPETAKAGIERGKEIFTRNCMVCHGPEGIGGVPNKNSAAGVVPSLGDLARRKKLGRAVVDQLVRALQGGRPLRDIEPSFDETTRRVLRELRETIRNGRPVPSRDPADPPPFQMQAWKDVLSANELEAVIAYLLTTQR